MVRIFGLLTALFMSTSVANAALLASWTFTNANDTASSAGTVAPGISGSSGNFTNYGTSSKVNGTNGSVQGNVWRTAAINTINTGYDISKGNEFSFTNTSSAPPKQLVIDNVTFQANVNVDSDDDNSSVRIRVFTSLNGGSYVEASSFASIGAGLASFSTINNLALNRTLGAGEVLSVRFVYSGFRTDANGTRVDAIMRLDNVLLNGSEAVVPEPASMACFAGLFAVGALRRFRKRA